MAIEIVDLTIKNGDFSIVVCMFNKGYPAITGFFATTGQANTSWDDDDDGLLLAWKWMCQIPNDFHIESIKPY